MIDSEESQERLALDAPLRLLSPRHPCCETREEVVYFMQSKVAMVNHFRRFSQRIATYIAADPTTVRRPRKTAMASCTRS